MPRTVMPVAVVEALLDLRMDVVLPRHHDHRAGLACRSARGKETGEPGQCQSGAGRAPRTLGARSAFGPRPTPRAVLPRVVPLALGACR